MRRKKLIWGIGVGGLFLVFLAAGLTYTTQIPSYENLPADQKQCVDAFVEQAGIRPGEINPHDRKKSLELIEKVRAHIFRTITIGYKGDKYKQSNEPCAVLERRWGNCFNVSRLFELSMQKLGYRTRHIFLCTILFHDEGSHAISEALVDGRWLGVDTFYKDVKFYNGENLFGVKEALKNKNLVSLNRYYEKNYFVIYGLYSRSGRLFQPRILWPDVNVREFLYNFAH